MTPDDLRTGDLLLFRGGRSPLSWLIRRATNSPYSHVGIAVVLFGTPFVVEALSTVRITPLAKRLAAMPDHERVEMRRLPVSTEAKEHASSYAMTRIGRPYDVIGLIRAGIAAVFKLYPVGDSKRLDFCTELVGRGYAPYWPVGDPDILTPEQVSRWGDNLGELIL